MESLVCRDLLDELDGLNPARALILQAYYALRRAYGPMQIGTQQIVAWIKAYEPEESFPSESLILLTLRQANVVHRPRGRPRHDRPTPVPGSPFLQPARSRNRARRWGR
jgi:hypothetical protein